jgi:PAS domain S-box-containing protein
MIRVLIVDDSDDDALLIMRQFRSAGIEATSERVETPATLAAALGGTPPDVVICDYSMPALSAHGALEIVRDSGLDVPFILVSGEIGEETAAALMRAGAHDFVLKDRLARLVPAVERELREAADRRQRRTAQSALRESEERFRLIAEHAQDIIFRFRRGADPGLEYLSPAVTGIIGHTPDAVYADPSLLFSIVEPTDRDLFEASWRSSEPDPITVRWQRTDGGLAYMEQRAVAVRGPDGTIVAVEGILRDVTERVVAEQERERLEHQLRQNERLDSLGHLAGGVAHDFNNLLAVITGYCGMIAESLPEDDPGLDDVEGIRKAADRGAALTRQLLIFSRLEPSRLETVNLNAVVTETRELLTRTLGEDIQFVTDLADDLRVVTVDRSKMEQVLLNLIMNARAAMPAGGQLTIRTWNTEDGDRVSLSVTDVGHGMEPEVARRAFEPFFTTRPKGQGTGLGLATAYGAVVDAGGSIELETEPGHGTTVRVCLPASVRQVLEHATTTTEPPVGHGESVLLVVDEDAVREVVLRILTRSGYRVREVGSPLEALRIFASSADHFDMLLTDVVMPGMSGTQLAAQLREIRPDLPVLFMSGYTMGPTPGGQALPADGTLLHKPFDRPALLTALHKSLHRTTLPTL